MVLGGHLLDHKLAPSASYMLLGLDEVGMADVAVLFVCGRDLGSKDICWGVLQLIAVVDLSRVAANNF